MEVINNETRKVKISLKTRLHPYNQDYYDGDKTLYLEELTIKNGKIVQISWSSPYDKGNFYLTNSKYDYPIFLARCCDSIRFIAKYNPEELKNIYDALSEGAVKDFCKNLQKELIKEFQSNILSLVF